MVVKEFFRRRSVAQMLEFVPVYLDDPSCYHSLIEDIDGARESVVLFKPILPELDGRVSGWSGTSTRGQLMSRKAYKYGAYIALDQPKGMDYVVRKEWLPVRVINRTIRELGDEDDVWMGYSFEPVLAQKDKRRTVVPFVYLPEAMRIQEYARRFGGGIRVERIYDDSVIAEETGGQVVVSVPSRRKKVGRYEIIVDHVPLNGAEESMAAVWSQKRKYGRGGPPRHRSTLFRFGGGVIEAYPQDIAAVHAVEDFFSGKGNPFPRRLTLFPRVSSETMEYDGKLRNNVLMHDRSLKGEKLRRLHLAERSVLLGRYILEKVRA